MAGVNPFIVIAGGAPAKPREQTGREATGVPTPGETRACRQPRAQSPTIDKSNFPPAVGGLG